MRPRLRTDCKIHGCTRTHRAKGFCARHYAQHHRNTSPLLGISCHDLGGFGERRFYEECALAGRSIEKMPHNHPYDFTVDGWHIDVKTASPVQFHKTLQWQFRLNVNGKQSPLTDFYVLRMEAVPFAKPVYLLLKPSRRLVQTVTVNGILHKPAIRALADDYCRFVRGGFGQKSHLESVDAA